ncbi:MAG: hypothetical protein HRT68_11920 [Flavobacteriaceae bacterium]|nr:hypothetical protein [Flavobacteriaceae bacterium]
MRKVYYLKTCDTCKRILKSLSLPSYFELQDIKESEITVNQLEEMHQLSISYEALFSKRAKLYKEMDLKNQVLSEADYRHYILHHYTFLKRPVIIVDNEIFIGNAKKVVASASERISTL